MAQGQSPAGRMLGGYRIIEMLGEGGMGAVYKAVDDHAGRTVALKVISRALAQDEAFLKRFEREARAVAAVKHPSVVVTHAFGQDQGVWFLVLEHLPGGTLKAWIKTEGALPWREAATLGAQVARGLEAIHAAGLVHRDLKPENVLFDAEGRPKISDFGLVRRTTGGQSVELTKTGEVVGTLEFMSPEQADGRKGVDARADLYGLGATLYATARARPRSRRT